MLGILYAFLSADYFFFQNTIRVSNNLDPDQAKYFFRADLGPNCLQRLSVEKTMARKEFKLRARSHEHFFFGKDRLSQKLWQTICVHT